MKRCPECRHAYPDEVKFCRADGTLLVADSEGEAGTIKLPASRQVETAETCILPTEKAQAGNAQTIDEALSDDTAQTTLLGHGRVSGGTKELSRPKRGRAAVVLAALIRRVRLPQ